MKQSTRSSEHSQERNGRTDDRPTTDATAQLVERLLVATSLEQSPFLPSVSVCAAFVPCTSVMQPVFALHRPCAPRCFAPCQLSRWRQRPLPWSSPVELARSPLPRLGLPRQRQLNLQRLCSEAPDKGGSPASSSSAAAGAPGLVEANFVYCLGVCWLVFLTDMSGVGPLLLASDNVALSLALLQWGAFLLPVVATSVAARFDLARTFALRPCSAPQLAGGLLGGASLWALLSAAVALRAGVTPEGAEASYRLVESISTVWAAPETATQWGELLGLGALAPSAAEELLFRGYLLTAIRSRLGAVDAVRARLASHLILKRSLA